MGALTLKSFPYELRGWDIEKFESIDPTDGFGSSTRVYISKQQIVQIEPDHSENTSKTWLSDKGRQFFDGIFTSWDNKNKNVVLKKELWQKNIKTLLKTFYLFEHCSSKTKKNYFFTIVFENIGLETLSLLKMMEQNYSFLKLRRAEKLNLSNDMEFDFQLNATTNFNWLKSSTLCLLVNTNPRYEGYHLNLNLKQRYLKGNFKCLKLGSLIDLTFPCTSIGTNIELLKYIAEGNHFVCQDFRTSKNPLLVFSTEFYKRTDGINVVEMFKTSKYANIFNCTWNGLNTLNLALSDVGAQNVANFLPLENRDLNELSSFYFVNVNASKVPNLKKITKAKLLGYTGNGTFVKQPSVPKLVLDQNNYLKNNKAFLQNSLKRENIEQYHFLPAKMFYESGETFINTEGLIKRTNKLIANKKARNGWKLLRNLSKHFKISYTPLNFRNNHILVFNANKQSTFLNFLNFNYLAVKKLDSSRTFLTTQNQPFFISKDNTGFKKKSIKIKTTKFKYWLDDFFTGGKDEYTKNSLVLANCSKILRTQSTNFF